MFKGVWKFLLGAHSLHKAEARNITRRSTMLYLYSNRLGKFARWITSEPEDSTDKTFVFREFIVTREGDIDAYATFVNVRWKTVIMNMECETKFFPVPLQ